MMTCEQSHRKIQHARELGWHIYTLEVPIKNNRYTAFYRTGYFLNSPKDIPYTDGKPVPLEPTENPNEFWINFPLRSSQAEAWDDLPDEINEEGE